MGSAGAYGLGWGSGGGCVVRKFDSAMDGLGFCIFTPFMKDYLPSEGNRHRQTTYHS